MAVLDIEYGKQILEENQQKPAVRPQTSQELEMVLHNSSFGHEYARLKLESTADIIQREEIYERMEACRNAYFAARLTFEQQDPGRLQTIETSILDQKVRIFGVYRA